VLPYIESVNPVNEEIDDAHHHQKAKKGSEIKLSNNNSLEMSWKTPMTSSISVRLDLSSQPTRSVRCRAVTSGDKKTLSEFDHR
jgi:hypothetical protein